jgi:tight adherence protein C
MNINPIVIQYIYGGLLGLVGIAILISGAQFSNRLNVRKRLDQFINEQGGVNASGKRRTIITREYSGSLISRTFIPLVRRLINRLGQFTPENSIQQLDHQISIAKNPYNLTARSFYAIRVIFVVLGILFGILFYVRENRPGIVFLVLGLAIILLFVMAPHYWLLGRVHKTQDEVRRGLPDVLDMLSVCTGAGMSFDQAIMKISDYWDTTIGFEFKRVIQEMEMGFSRTEALRNMSNRLDVLELSSFVAVIIQAETLGMQIADVLHGQAAQMRIVRQLRAREISNRLPAKMVFPLAFFILPALLAVLLGPVIPSFMTLVNFK